MLTLAKGLWRTSNIIAFLVALITGLCAYLLFYLEIINAATACLTLIAAAAFTLPVAAMVNLRRAMLQALNQVIAAQAYGQVLRNVVLILGIISIIILSDNHLSVESILWLNLATYVAALFAGQYLIRKYLPRGYFYSNAAFENRAWITIALSVFIFKVMTNIDSQADLLMLGIMKGSYEVGIYNIAKKFAGLSSFGLLAVNMFLQPVISGLFAENKKEQLQKILYQGVIFSTIISLFISAGLIIFRQYILNFYGEEFSAGSTSLIILTIAEFLNVAFGSVATILILTGYQREANIGVAIALAANIILNLILIPPFGVMGAAYGAFISTILWNAIMLIYLKRRTGLNTSIAGAISKANEKA